MQATHALRLLSTVGLSQEAVGLRFPVDSPRAYNLQSLDGCVQDLIRPIDLH